MGEPTPPLPTTSTCVPCERRSPCAARRGRTRRRRTGRRRSVPSSRSSTALAAPATARSGVSSSTSVDRGDLVRHGHQRTADVGEVEQRPEEVRVVLGTCTPIGHDDGVYPVLLEPRVVDHRRLEGERRIAQVRDEGGLPADHGWSLPVAFRPMLDPRRRSQDPLAAGLSSSGSETNARDATRLARDLVHSLGEPDHGAVPRCSGSMRTPRARQRPGWDLSRAVEERERYDCASGCGSGREHHGAGVERRRDRRRHHGLRDRRGGRAQPAAT